MTAAHVRAVGLATEFPSHSSSLPLLRHPCSTNAWRTTTNARFAPRVTAESRPLSAVPHNGHRTLNRKHVATRAAMSTHCRQQAAQICRTLCSKSIGHLAPPTASVPIAMATQLPHACGNMSMSMETWDKRWALLHDLPQRRTVARPVLACDSDLRCESEGNNETEASRRIDGERVHVQGATSSRARASMRSRSDSEPYQLQCTR